jgi:hypothetical protein
LGIDYEITSPSRRKIPRKTGGTRRFRSAGGGDDPSRFEAGDA